MACPLEQKKSGRFREVSVVERCPFVEVRLQSSVFICMTHLFIHLPVVFIFAKLLLFRAV